MQIAYIAKHNQNNNDDEGAITYALTKLGHEVTCIDQRADSFPELFERKYDLCLFHRWEKAYLLDSLKCPKICWFFDEMNFHNRKHIAFISPHTTIVAVTDGQEVTGHNHIFLPQGIDERISPLPANPECFRYIGTLRGKRRGFVERMRNRFIVALHGTKKNNKVYRSKLGVVVASSTLCIAPPYPIKERYWSNRAYLLSAYGGVIAHPICSLREHYIPGKEMIFYDNEDHLYDIMSTYTFSPEIREAAIERTKMHTYRKRLDYLVNLPFSDSYLQTR